MFKHRMEIVYNHDNDHLDWLFHYDIFPLRESTSIMSGNAKGSHLTNYLEVHSLNSDQVPFSIPLKAFSEFSGLSFVFLCFLIVV